jgi:hypothetical protein
MELGFQGARFEFFMLQISNSNIQKSSKKIPSQCFTLSLCKFSEQNTLYFGLSKNDKIEFSMYCSLLFIDDKISICHFSWAQSTNIFRSENLHTYRNNIVYGIFFLNLFKMFEFEISKVQNSASMEAELQMTALLMKVRSKLIYNEVELSRGIINWANTTLGHNQTHDWYHNRRCRYNSP